MRQDVIVVGAGVIGLFTSYYLIDRGYRVALFDKGRVGYEASRYNAGYIVPGMYEPLPLSARVPAISRWLLARYSPVEISPRVLLSGWFTSFMKYRYMLRGGEWRILRRAGGIARRLIKDLIQGEGIECSFMEAGILEAFTDEGVFGEVVRHLDEVRSDGVKLRVLDCGEARELEPSLSRVIVGGIHYLEEIYLRPEALIDGLVRVLTYRGVDIYENRMVTGIEVDGDTINVKSDGEVFKCRVAIISSGPWTNEILRGLGLGIKLLPARGYLIFLRGGGSPLPRIPVMLEEVKIASTPHIDGEIRLGGLLDLVGFDGSIHSRRLRWMIREASRYIPALRWCRVIGVRSAFRPLTPDELPVIGRLPGFKDIYIAVGHGRFGLTYSALTGILLSQIISGDKPIIDPSIFNPGRLITRC